MQVTLTQIVIILVSGLVAGFVNTIAGGGSFLTLAALELAGLPGALANGTNRVAVEVQNIMAVLGFRSKGISNLRLSLALALPALLGAILGAYIIIDLPELVFHRVLAVAMLMMLAILIVNPKRWLSGREVTLTPGRAVVGFVAFFAIGFYGGAIQAGVGFLLITALVLVAGLDLVKTNSHKVFIIGTYTLFALLMFTLRGQVNWVLGLVLAVGNGTGGWVASRLSVEKGERLVRIVLGVMLVVLTVRYLELIPGF
ncbi:MAG: sulfite exporter TauE/SafE family protein [Anaerolineae bacterium]|nr:sulfite exporter TauE/SafE family protein [Anaerolineae bacterium]